MFILLHELESGVPTILNLDKVICFASDEKGIYAKLDINWTFESENIECSSFERLYVKEDLNEIFGMLKG